MLLTGSEDELCGPLPALFQAVACHWPAVGPSAFQPLFTECSYKDQLLASPPHSSVLSASHLLRCALAFSCLFIVSVFFHGGSVCPGCYSDLSQGLLGEYFMMFVLTCLVCPMSPKQVWSWCLVVAAVLLFSQEKLSMG
jgi:hypothetical protein